MKLTVRVKPSSRSNTVTKLEDGSYKVTLVAPPEKGKANLLLVEVLAGYFNVSKSQVEILAGHSARTKILRISR